MNSLAKKVQRTGKDDSLLPCDVTGIPVVDDRACGDCLGKRQDSGIADIAITCHQASSELCVSLCLCGGLDSAVLDPIGVEHRLDSRVDVQPLPQFRQDCFRDDGAAFAYDNFEDAEDIGASEMTQRTGIED